MDRAYANEGNREGQYDADAIDPESANSLMSIPRELLDAIAANLSIRDIATLQGTSGVLGDLIQSGKIATGDRLLKIALALVDAPSDQALLDAIEVAGGCPFRERITILHALGAGCPGMAAVPESAVAEAFNVALRGALRDPGIYDSDLEVDPRLLADVEITVLNAFFPSAQNGLREDLITRFASAMRSFDTKVWPDMLDALGKRGVVVPDIDVDEPALSKALSKALCEPGPDLEGLSDFGVRALCSPRLLDVDGTTALSGIPGLSLAVRFQRRFGISDAQWEILIKPEIARQMVDRLEAGSESFGALWQQWIGDDASLAAMTVDNYLERCLSLFRKQQFSWEAAFDEGLQLPLSNWMEIQQGFFRKVEADSFASWSSSATFQNVDHTLNAMTLKITQIVDEVSRPNQDITVLKQHFALALSVPMDFQPLLIDRWAHHVRHAELPGNGDTLLQNISNWRKQAVDKFLSDDRPVSAVRACVAELRAWINGTAHKGLSAASQKKEAIVDTVFASMPVPAWTSMLSLISEFSEKGIAVIEPHRLSAMTAVFLMDIHSQGHYSSPAFSRHLCKVASLMFERLPDQSSEMCSKFDHFCTRMGIQDVDQRAMKSIVLDGIASRIGVCEIGKRSAVGLRLSANGFTDPASIEYVMEMLKKRAAALG